MSVCRLPFLRPLVSSRSHCSGSQPLLKLYLILGSIGSLWSLARTGNEGFVIFSGCMLGIGAAFLWTTQGAVTMSYPPESERARAFSYETIIYTLGSSVGGLVALADSVSNNELSSVNNGT